MSRLWSWLAKVATILGGVFRRRRRPPPPRHLHLSVEKGNHTHMATVTATWTPSVTPDVTSQTLTWTVNGAARTPVVFHDNTTGTSSVTANPGDVVSAALYCTSPEGNSPTATAAATVPFGPPAAPTMLALTVTP